MCRYLQFILLYEVLYDQLMSYTLANIYDLLDSREPSGENGMASFPRK